MLVGLLIGIYQEIGASFHKYWYSEIKAIKYNGW